MITLPKLPSREIISSDTNTGYDIYGYTLDQMKEYSLECREVLVTDIGKALMSDLNKGSQFLNKQSAEKFEEDFPELSKLLMENK
jgi:hypothetical protein